MHRHDDVYRAALAHSQTAWKLWMEGRSSSDEPALFEAWKKAARIAVSLEPPSIAQLRGFA